MYIHMKLIKHIKIADQFQLLKFIQLIISIYRIICIETLHETFHLPIDWMQCTFALDIYILLDDSLFLFSFAVT